VAEGTKIEWADHTFNPWEGCQKVGPGCDHCYAEARNARYAHGSMVAPNWGPGAPRRRTSQGNWNKPRKWNRAAEAFAEAHGRRQRVFCASLADVFDNAVDPGWRRDLFDLIDETPMLDWLLLTKRIGNVMPMLADLGRECLPVHVWLGATIVNQEEADRDIPKLLDARAAVRFLSMEPLLGPVELAKPLAAWQSSRTNDQKAHIGWGTVLLDWVIVGGESGTGSRPMHPGWVQSLRDQCEGIGIPFLFKQWGDWEPATDRAPDRYVTWEGRSLALYEAITPLPDYAPVSHVGKRRAGRMLLGRTYDGFPHA
jgi:protein gp37